MGNPSEIGMNIHLLRFQVLSMVHAVLETRMNIRVRFTGTQHAVGRILYSYKHCSVPDVYEYKVST